MIQAASGRNRAVSSGSAWGSRPSSSSPGEMPSWAASVAAPPPSTKAWVTSEKVVAQTTNVIASGPALSWIQRHTPL